MATRMAMCPLSFARQHSPLGPPGAQVPVQDHAELASRIAVLDRVLGPHPHFPEQSEIESTCRGRLGPNPRRSQFEYFSELRTCYLRNGRPQGGDKTLVGMSEPSWSN